MHTVFDDVFFDTLISEAEKSPRKRSHRNIHKDEKEAVQRLCIGLVPGTYVRPHIHTEPHKWEMIIALKGNVSLLIFDDNGTVTRRLELSPGGKRCGIEIEPGTWHTLFPTGGNAVIMEIKQGPYSPSTVKNFADWSPGEGSPKAETFLAWARLAAIGEMYEH